MASSRETIAWAFVTPDKPELVALVLAVVPELVELQAASRAAAARTPAPASQLDLCVIAYAFHPAVHAGSVNGSFLLRYTCNVTNDKGAPFATMIGSPL